MNNTTPTPTNAGKAFNQAELNRIVGERLARERYRLETALDEREQQLAQRELLVTAKERLQQMDLPVVLADALNVASPEALEKALELIKAAMDGTLPMESNDYWAAYMEKLRKAFGLPKNEKGAV